MNEMTAGGFIATKQRQGDKTTLPIFPDIHNAPQTVFDLLQDIGTTLVHVQGSAFKRHLHFR